MKEKRIDATFWVANEGLDDAGFSASLKVHNNHTVTDYKTDAITVHDGPVEILYATNIIYKSDNEGESDLPTCVKIPMAVGENSTDAIMDYLSSKTGCPVEAFVLEQNLPSPKVKDFNLNISFSKDERNEIWIGEESGSGAKYHGDTLDELVEAFKSYVSNYLTVEDDEKGENA